jgi:Tol biopolymer transport system component
VGGVARYAEIDVSPDGLRVAASIAEASGVQARDIWILDLARNVPTRVTSSRLDERSPAWSPDGARIAFIAGSSQSTKHTIFVRPTDGSASPRPVAEVGGNAGGLSWVPDGTALLFASRSAQPGGGGDILSVSLSGASVPVPVIASEFDERSPAVSPDGRWLAYRSNESGSDEVHIVAFRRPGPHVQVSNGGGASPRWSVDGKEIFYTVHEGQTTNQPGRLMSASLAISGNRIEVGVPRERFTQLVAGNSSEWPYDVSPDGRRILAILPPVASVTPITVVRNWTASLARRGPSSVR